MPGGVWVGRAVERIGVIVWVARVLAVEKLLSGRAAACRMPCWKLSKPLGRADVVLASTAPKPLASIGNARVAVPSATLGCSSTPFHTS
jgi:hypothetical protein